MKDPVKLTHSHLEIRSMVEELESVHFPSQEFQTMLGLYEMMEESRNKEKGNMDVSELGEYYNNLSQGYERLQKAANAYVDKKDSDPDKGKEANRTPEEEKRYRTAEAISQYADEMNKSCLYYRSEAYAVNHLVYYKRQLKKSSTELESKKENALELCRQALKFKTLQENKDQYFVTQFYDGRVGYINDKQKTVGIFPAGCDPEDPKTLVGLNSNAQELLDKVEIKETPENAKWLAEKARSLFNPFDDLDDISSYIQTAYRGVSGKDLEGVTFDQHQGHLYFRAAKETFYDNDDELRRCLIDKINAHNYLVENAGGPVNGVPKIKIPDINSKTFYQDLQNAVSQKDGEQKPMVDVSGRRVYLPGAKKLGKLAERMLRFRKAVDEIAPEKAKETVKDQDTIKTGREEQAVKNCVTDAVERMKNNPIRNQNAKELNSCLGQIVWSLRAMNAQLEKCEKGSPIYVYAQERAVKPLINYMVSAINRHNELYADQIRLPNEQENSLTFFAALKQNTSGLEEGNPFREIAENAVKITNVPLTELGQEYAARAKQQREYKQLAAKFKYEVDKSMFPSDEYKKMADLFKKASSAGAEPNLTKRAKAYQDLYNAASDYLLYKDPALNGKPNKKLSEYEKKRVKFAEDLRDFCKRGGANPENYKNEKKFTERKVQQPAKGGLGLG